MASGSFLEGFPKPFANYDVVVYFGGALFATPFVNRYLIEPLGARFPTYNIVVGTEIASQTVSVLCLLFSLYIIGHIAAYVSSQLIEKAVDTVFGKISSAIYVSAASNAKGRNEAIRALIFDRLKKVRSKNSIFSSLVRGFFHVPMMPWYILIFLFGVFGYYDTRVPQEAMVRLKNLYKDRISDEAVNINTKWFKPVEYYVINRCPGAVPRMYNYLVISGLFRTLSLIFLFSTWMMVYFTIHYAFHGDWLLKPLFGLSFLGVGILEYALLATIYLFCLFSYQKFQRRYAEEAIFTFVYAKCE